MFLAKEMEVSKEYIRRLTKVLKSKLNSENLVLGASTSIVLL